MNKISKLVASKETLFIILGIFALGLVLFFAWPSKQEVVIVEEKAEVIEVIESPEDPRVLSDNKIGVSEQNIVLTEAFSLSCPACAQYHPILKQIREEYKDRVVFQAVHFPLAIHFPNALAGHQAIEAAGRQGKFWEMHDTLFEQRELWTGQYTSNPVPQIEVFAEELGLDIEKFREDFKSNEVRDIIRSDEEHFGDLGVISTPSFFLNDEKINPPEFNTPETARTFLDKALSEEE